MVLVKEKTPKHWHTKGAATMYTNTRSCPPGFPKHACTKQVSNGRTDRQTDGWTGGRTGATKCIISLLRWR